MRKMENKTLMAIVIALILTSEVLIEWQYSQEGEEGETIPPESQEKYNQLNQWLDEETREWKPKEYKPMLFSRPAHHRQ